MDSGQMSWRSGQGYKGVTRIWQTNYHIRFRRVSSWVHRSCKVANLTTLKVESRISSLFESGWNFKNWEESFTKATGGIEDKSYIAALQRTLATRAECLIMIGGGSFQDLTMKDYNRKHPRKKDQCIHSVHTTNVEYVLKRDCYLQFGSAEAG